MVTACAVRVALFSWRFIIPVIIFVLCYWKITSALRRRTKVATRRRQQQQQPAATPSTSTADSADHSKPPRKTQKNVIKTMIIIISCFIVCWLPLQFTLVIQTCDMNPFTSMTLFYAFGVMSVVNFCANPFIYATGMYPFLREKFVAGLRRLVRRENQVADAVELQNTGSSSRRNVINVRPCVN